MHPDTRQLHLSQASCHTVGDHRIVFTRPLETRLYGLVLALIIAGLAYWPTWIVFRASVADARRHQYLPELILVMFVAIGLWWATFFFLKVVLPYSLSLDFTEHTYWIEKGITPFRRTTRGTFADIDSLYIRWHFAKGYGQRAYVMLLKWKVKRAPFPLGMSFSESGAEADMRTLAEAIGTAYVGKITLQPPQT